MMHAHTTETEEVMGLLLGDVLVRFWCFSDRFAAVLFTIASYKIGCSSAV